MKTVWVLVLLAFVLLPVKATAAEYVFNCRNEWTQLVTIRVTAESIDKARAKLKTDRTIRKRYSLDATSSCVFVSEQLQEDGTSKPMPKVKKKVDAHE